MQLVERHIVKDEKFMDICVKAKNLYNQSLYYYRQSVFKNIEYFNEYELTGLFAEYQEENYISLPAQTSQQVIKLMFKNIKSWQKSRKEFEKNPNKFLGRPKLPNYKKETSICIFTNQQVSVKNGFISFPKKTDLPNIKTKQYNLQQVRIIPKLNHCIVEVVYNSKDIEIHKYNGKWMGVDLGVNNLAACTTENSAFLIDGKPLKSMNQGFNKTRGKVKGLLPLLGKHILSKTGNRIQKGSSRKVRIITEKRNRKVDDYMHKASRFIVNNAMEQGITKIIIGNNKNWKQEIKIGVKNNNTFCSIPHDTLIEKIKYKAQMDGIQTICTQEAYSSKCSALDFEAVKKHKNYVGRRKKRGLFVTKNGIKINADCNGSLNIARLELSATGDEITISESLVRCVSQPKKVNILYNKIELLKQFSKN
ncbi:MAG: transposase [Hyphomicrobium sp.]|uniref:RNA-guided endonuclease InsQ/TnpB family protein n=1 Tax=Hyphomicrobium sp. TaxID=82 RepID=UPI003564432A